MSYIQSLSFAFEEYLCMIYKVYISPKNVKILYMSKNMELYLYNIYIIYIYIYIFIYEIMLFINIFGNNVSNLYTFFLVLILK